MFFVIRRWNEKPTFAKEAIDPLSRSTFKQDQPSIIAVVPLTQLGWDQTIETLRDMWLAEMFAKASPFKQAEPEKPKALPKPKPPKKQIIGEAR